MSTININELEETTRLPPVICSNLRKKIIGVQLPIDTIKLKHQEKVDRHQPLVVYREPSAPTPQPKYPIVISWAPENLHFYLFEESVTIRLRVLNRCTRPIYIQCCGLWGDTSRLGASWCSYPRTRFWLSPGLKADFYIQATPRPYTPIKSSYCSLQIAASQFRDCVTGYFAVPINVSFLKYVPPLYEGE